ncbi:MAG: hypothetical protein ABIJ45_05730, partial [Candidatus Zixiibacteriota bacterium]
SGCSRDIENEILGFDPPDNPPVPINLTVNYLSDSVTVNWEVNDTLTGISFAVYYIDSIEYYADTSSPDFVLWETTSSFSSIINSLTPGRPYLIFIAAILSGNFEGSKSDPISVRTGILSLSINDGDEYTNSRNVNVSFVVPRPASLIMLSENTGFAGAIWRTYSSNSNFELSDNDEMKYLYARLRFLDGSESEAIMSSIILDTRAQIDSVYFSPVPASFSSGDTVTFYLATNEPNGSANVSVPGVSNIELEYDFLASIPANSIYIYSCAYVIAANLEVVNGQVTGSFTDQAGNRAESVDAISHINVANDPIAVTLTAVPISSSSIRLNWSLNNNGDFTAYQIYRTTTGTVTNDDEPIAVITSQSTLTYTDVNLPSELTSYYYRIFVYDNTGRSSGSNTAEGVTLFNAAPTPVELSGRIELQDGDTVVVLSWSANHDDDFATYRVFRYTDSTTVNYTQWNALTIIGNSGTTSFTDDLPQSAQNYYQVQVVDAQGKRANSNWIEINF